MENDLFIKELYQKSLNEKWNVIVESYKKFQDTILPLDCAFCNEYEDDCEVCQIDKQICDKTGSGGLYRKYTDCLSDLRRIINYIKNEIENKIKN